MEKNNIFMRIILSLAAAVFFSFSLNAVEIGLADVCRSLSAHANTSGDFTQIKTLQTNGRKLTSTGRFIFCPLGILWRTEKPFPASLILTDEYMIQISAGGKKSVISGKDNQTFENISGTLRSVFSGNVTELEKNFVCEFSSAGEGEWAVRLTPKDSTIAGVMQLLVLSGKVSGSSEAVLEVLEMTESSQNTIRYEFKNQEYPKELSDEEKKIFVLE